MIDQLLGILAPHHCYGCGKTGPVLCENCIFDIKNEPFERCLVCLRPASGSMCKIHSLPYSRSWCVGAREGLLEHVIDDYKFMRVRAGARALGGLLHSAMSVLPSHTVVMAIPSIPAHIRHRGYDHAVLLAREVARQRGLSYDQVLRRQNAEAQRGASKAKRLEQAKRAFSVYGEVKKDIPYLLIDDVYTTGATVHYAAQALRDAGASEVWVAVLARQVSTEKG